MAMRIKDLILFRGATAISAIIYRIKDTERTVAADMSDLAFSCLFDAFFLSMCGNSPFALIVVAAFAIVGNNEMDFLRNKAVQMYGGLYSGFGGYALAFLAFMFFVVPFVVQGLLYIAVESLPVSSSFCKKYKLQKHTNVPRAEMLKVLVESVVRLFVFGLPFVMCIMSVTVVSKGKLGVVLQGPIPSHFELLRLLLVHIAVLEILFYAVHRILHTPRLYRSIHKIHHEYTAPFAIASLHCHPLELVASNLFPVTAGFLMFRPHIFFVFMWITGVALGTQTHHSGIRFPWIAEIDNQPDYHDMHHRVFTCNYGMLGFMDYLFATQHKKT